jgi:hypothetical protein
MNPLDPAQLPLRDIHLPDAIAWWPPAPGWWLLAGLAVAAIVVLALKLWRGRRHRAARRELARIITALDGGADPAQCARRASVLLRRFAMTLDEDSPGIAGLAGERWLDYVARHGKNRGLFEHDGGLLLDVPYREPRRVSADQARNLCRLCADWIAAQPARA